MPMSYPLTPDTLQGVQELVSPWRALWLTPKSHTLPNVPGVELDSSWHLRFLALKGQRAGH